MLWQDREDRFGLISIILHWVTALLVLSLLALGFAAYLMARGEGRTSVLTLHVSLGLLLVPVYLVRIFWRWRYGKPAAEQASPVLRILAEAVWRLLLVLILVQLLSGPFLVWLHGRPVAFFGLFRIMPIVAENHHFHAVLVRPIHLTTGVLLVALICLHIAGALKHVLIDRDGVTQRMFSTRETVERH